jgi:hypothetical protein
LLEAGRLAEERFYIFLCGYPELQLQVEADLWPDRAAAGACVENPSEFLKSQALE